MIILLVGVAGSGKTTVGSMLSKELGWRFIDADGYHPQANVAKMRSGSALSEGDRGPWLRTLNRLLLSLQETRVQGVLACSALTRSSRSRLLEGIDCADVVYLKGDPRLIEGRLNLREGHFFENGLLQSQFETLEEPDDVLVVAIEASPSEIVAMIRKALKI